jgi:XTP/dITP diphosphohydrolase
LKLLVGEENRGAVFRSVVCMVTEGGEKIVAEGEVKGVITREPRGSGGFGFDPIFAPAGAGGKTFAEMTRDEKNRLSHRGAAVRGLLRRIVGQP